MATSRTGTAKWKAVAKQARTLAQERGQTRCPRCRIWLDWEYSRRPNSAEVDHIKPHTQGGTDTLDNTQILCRKCNQSLGGKQNGRAVAVETVALEASDIW